MKKKQYVAKYEGDLGESKAKAHAKRIKGTYKKGYQTYSVMGFRGIGETLPVWRVYKKR